MPIDQQLDKMSMRADSAARMMYPNCSGENQGCLTASLFCTFFTPSVLRASFCARSNCAWFLTVPVSVTSPFLVSTEISEPLMAESLRIDDLILVVITLSSMATPALVAVPLPEVPEEPEVPDDVPVSDDPDARDAVVVSVVLLPEDACPSAGWRRLQPPANTADSNTATSTVLEVLDIVFIRLRPFHGERAGLPVEPAVSLLATTAHVLSKAYLLVVEPLVVPVVPDEELEPVAPGVDGLVPPVVPLVEPDGLVVELLEPGDVVALPVPDVPVSEPDVPADDVPPVLPVVPVEPVVPLVAAEPPAVPAVP
jgi:hypothetical protein